MIVGFTGTRDGMTEAQRKSVRALVKWLQPAEAHHGECKGADFEFYEICRKEDVCMIVAHPPLNEKHRVLTESNIHRDPRPYLARNHKLVNDSECLIAAPSTEDEQLRSGTWATVRYARARGRKIYLVNPDGCVNAEGLRVGLSIGLYADDTEALSPQGEKVR